jgi:K+-transporting ATPase ATPase A chain
MPWLWAVAAWATVALILVLCYRPLGDYMAWVFTSDRHWRVERATYRLIGVRPDAEQSWGAYFRAVLVFSVVGMVLLYGLQRLQPWLPYSLGLPAVPPDLAFNTAASFVANTNWQAFSPEHTLGYTVQMAGIAVQCFVSAAVGIAVAIALVRGLAARRTGTVGNFWVDLVRANLRLLLPLSMVVSVILIAEGVVQNFAGFTEITTVAGQPGVVPGGPVASQEAILMLGTNGGGFYNANSAHPFENATPVTNLVQILLLLIIPFALPRTLGTMVGDRRLGRMIALAMALLCTTAYVLLTTFELGGHGTAPQLAGGSMEGKEQRFGIISSTLFAAATTGTSGGAANSMHDSYTALGGLVAIMHMSLGELSPGGVGAGLYTILVMVVLTVFLAGLLLGRAPVLAGKRISVREVKIAAITILVLPALALGGMAISMAIPAVREEIVTVSMNNPGSHGLSEMIYAFVSATVNNGSSFAGFGADTPWLNTTLGLIMLAGRFLVIALVLVLAGSFANQDRAAAAVGELPLHRPGFFTLLVSIILFVALPTFLAILMAGPFAEGVG